MQLSSKPLKKPRPDHYAHMCTMVGSYVAGLVTESRGELESIVAHFPLSVLAQCNSHHDSAILFWLFLRSGLVDCLGCKVFATGQLFYP